ncbi:MAG TPA: hypothetical protein VFN03_03060 [Trueperaceae bacterium]|nr:hypothetical protein [Trueperaceae bacterium]
MNGNDLLMYSLMKQRQESLLSEAAAHHLARAKVRAVQLLGPDLVERGGTTARRVGRAGPHTAGPRTTRPLTAGPPTAGLRRLAARVGTSLVAVGQRLERMDRR